MTVSKYANTNVFFMPADAVVVFYQGKPMRLHDTILVFAQKAQVLDRAVALQAIRQSLDSSEGSRHYFIYPVSTD
jgi:hypothetical protein